MGLPETIYSIVTTQTHSLDLSESIHSIISTLVTRLELPELIYNCRYPNPFTWSIRIDLLHHFDLSHLIGATRTCLLNCHYLNLFTRSIQTNSLCYSDLNYSIEATRTYLLNWSCPNQVILFIRTQLLDRSYSNQFTLSLSEPTYSIGVTWIQLLNWSYPNLLKRVQINRLDCRILHHLSSPDLAIVILGASYLGCKFTEVMVTQKFGANSLF